MTVQVSFSKVELIEVALSSDIAARIDLISRSGATIADQMSSIEMVNIMNVDHFSADDLCARSWCLCNSLGNDKVFSGFSQFLGLFDLGNLLNSVGFGENVTEGADSG